MIITNVIPDTNVITPDERCYRYGTSAHPELTIFRKKNEHLSSYLMMI
ncbi:MAG: hypothetical protein O0V67_09090 [Methanocorpusculum sp.]|nr:hypothetical protein [Methanocorpusculum sp.]